MRVGQQFNRSSIHFGNFSQPSADPQKDKIYNYRSRISQSLSDVPSDPATTLTQFYHNKIFNCSQKYEVPVEEFSRSQRDEQKSYLQFFQTKRKFTKPYGELAKYTDTVRKNESILRRSQFDTPITVTQPMCKNRSKTNRVIKYFKTSSKTTKIENIVQQSTIEKEDQLFNKTIGSQFVLYRKLLNRQRNQTNDRICLNNSMNRILAAQAIDLQIRKIRPNTRNKTSER